MISYDMTHGYSPGFGAVLDLVSLSDEFHLARHAADCISRSPVREMAGREPVHLLKTQGCYMC